MSGDRYKIADQHATYFLTLTVVDRIDLFTRAGYSMIVVDSLNYCVREKNLAIYSWVIMSSHVHLVASISKPNELSDVLRDFKKFTSKEIIRRIQEAGESRREWLLDKFRFEAKRTGRATNYKVWRDDNHAITVDGYIDIEQKVNYIHDNPVKAMIVYHPEEYYFSSAIDYSGGKGLVRISMI